MYDFRSSNENEPSTLIGTGGSDWMCSFNSIDAVSTSQNEFESDKPQLIKLIQPTSLSKTRKMSRSMKTVTTYQSNREIFYKNPKNLKPLKPLKPLKDSQNNLDCKQFKEVTLLSQFDLLESLTLFDNKSQNKTVLPKQNIIKPKTNSNSKSIDSFLKSTYKESILDANKMNQSFEKSPSLFSSNDNDFSKSSKLIDKGNNVSKSIFNSSSNVFSSSIDSKMQSKNVDVIENINYNSATTNKINKIMEKNNSLNQINQKKTKWYYLPFNDSSTFSCDNNMLEKQNVNSFKDSILEFSEPETSLNESATLESSVFNKNMPLLVNSVVPLSKPYSKRKRYGEFELQDAKTIVKKLASAESAALLLMYELQIREQEFLIRFNQEKEYMARRMIEKELQREMEAREAAYKNWLAKLARKAALEAAARRELQRQQILDELKRLKELDERMRLDKIRELTLKTRERDMRLHDDFREKEENEIERRIRSGELYLMRKEDERSKKYEIFRKERDRLAALKKKKKLEKEEQERRDLLMKKLMEQKKSAAQSAAELYEIQRQKALAYARERENERRENDEMEMEEKLSRLYEDSLKDDKKSYIGMSELEKKIALFKYRLNMAINQYAGHVRNTDVEPHIFFIPFNFKNDIYYDPFSIVNYPSMKEIENEYESDNRNNTYNVGEEEEEPITSSFYDTLYFRDIENCFRKTYPGDFLPLPGSIEENSLDLSGIEGNDDTTSPIVSVRSWTPMTQTVHVDWTKFIVEDMKQKNIYSFPETYDVSYDFDPRLSNEPRSTLSSPNTKTKTKIDRTLKKNNYREIFGEENTNRDSLPSKINEHAPNEHQPVFILPFDHTQEINFKFDSHSTSTVVHTRQFQVTVDLLKRNHILVFEILCERGHVDISIMKPNIPTHLEAIENDKGTSPATQRVKFKDDNSSNKQFSNSSKSLEAESDEESEEFYKVPSKRILASGFCEAKSTNDIQTPNSKSHNNSNYSMFEIENDENIESLEHTSGYYSDYSNYSSSSESKMDKIGSKKTKKKKKEKNRKYHKFEINMNGYSGDLFVTIQTKFDPNNIKENEFFDDKNFCICKLSVRAYPHFQKVSKIQANKLSSLIRELNLLSSNDISDLQTKLKLLSISAHKMANYEPFECESENESVVEEPITNIDFNNNSFYNFTDSNINDNNSIYTDCNNVVTMDVFKQRLMESKHISTSTLTVHTNHTHHKDPLEVFKTHYHYNSKNSSSDSSNYTFQRDMNIMGLEYESALAHFNKLTKIRNLKAEYLI